MIGLCKSIYLRNKRFWGSSGGLEDKLKSIQQKSEAAASALNKIKLLKIDDDRRHRIITNFSPERRGA